MSLKGQLTTIFHAQKSVHFKFQFDTWCHASDFLIYSSYLDGFGWVENRLRRCLVDPFVTLPRSIASVFSVSMYAHLIQRIKFIYIFILRPMNEGSGSFGLRLLFTAIKSNYTRNKLTNKFSIIKKLFTLNE